MKILVSGISVIVLFCTILIMSGCSVTYTCYFGDKEWSGYHQNCFLRRMR